MSLDPSTISACHGAPKRVYVALDWYAVGLHTGIASYARKAGWILDVRNLRSAIIPEKSLPCDGIVCLLIQGSSLHHFVERAQAPVVTMGAFTVPNIPNVCPDDGEIAKMAADHFIGRGFRNFAFYAPSASPWEHARMEHFRAQLEQHGFRMEAISQCDNPISDRRSDEHLRWLGDRLGALPKPLAVMAEYDDPAMDLIDACIIRGIMVPEEVAILGCDNDALRCDFTPVPLSSVDVDQFSEGYRAAEILDHMMQGKKPPQMITRIPPKGVVTRKSTDILAVEHRLVAMALRKIFDRYKEPITAQEIAADIPMSARRLHDAFIKHIGRSIADEILRMRVDHAKRLLAESNKKAFEIAEMSGFTNMDRMGKVFKRLTGDTPSQYRKRSKR